MLDDIVDRSNLYAMARTELPPVVPDKKNGGTKKNVNYLPPNKLKAITRKDILFFLATYYYMGYCRLPAKTDYWVRQKSHSFLTRPLDGRTVSS